MQPKENGSDIHYEIYYVSPRMIIRKEKIIGTWFMYCDTFTIEGREEFT